jgi:hypothetical protein
VVADALCKRQEWNVASEAALLAARNKEGASQISASDALKGISPDGPSDPQSEGARAIAEARARLERLRPKE